ncbi:hypothetical protein HPP92_019763 [Vanilla planifolia]|uniref:Pentatricopeptide repeat-containing protein n=1 Tax=Vanilla planifolia TaxID=51239 RepID=A0A835Q5Z4_VANPL|nr:hypothetical protein HPP92_019763 [Vanilla planifolia]
MTAMARYVGKHTKFYELDVSAVSRSRVCWFHLLAADVGIRNGSGVFPRPSPRVVFYVEGLLKSGAHGAGGSGRRCFSCFVGFFQRRQKSMAWAPFTCNSLFLLPANICQLASTQSNYEEILSSISDSEQDITKVIELLLSRENKEMNSSKKLCGLYIKKLCCLGRLSDAVSLLFHLHDRQIQLDLDVYNLLLAATGEVSNFELFCGVFQKLLLSRLSPDINSYVHVAKAFLNLSNSDLLINFIREVSEITAHRDPTVVNRIIFCTGKSGQIDKSMTMFKELKNLKRKIDVVTFNTVLAILGRAGWVEKMLSEFTSMKELGYTPDIVTYNTLINCFRRLGRLDLCKACAKETLERGFQLDLQAYIALIDAFGRAGHVNDAMTLFVEMKKFHRPSIYAYRALIGNLKKHGKIELAQDLLEEMKSCTPELVGPSNFRRKRTN